MSLIVDSAQHVIDDAQAAADSLSDAIDALRPLLDRVDEPPPDRPPPDPDPGTRPPPDGHRPPPSSSDVVASVDLQLTGSRRPITQRLKLGWNVIEVAHGRTRGFFGVHCATSPFRRDLTFELNNGLVRWEGPRRPVVSGPLALDYIELSPAQSWLPDAKPDALRPPAERCVLSTRANLRRRFYSQRGPVVDDGPLGFPERQTVIDLYHTGQLALGPQRLQVPVLGNLPGWSLTRLRNDAARRREILEADLINGSEALGLYDPKPGAVQHGYLHGGEDLETAPFRWTAENLAEHSIRLAQVMERCSIACVDAETGEPLTDEDLAKHWSGFHPILCTGYDGTQWEIESALRWYAADFIGDATDGQRAMLARIRSWLPHDIAHAGRWTTDAEPLVELHGDVQAHRWLRSCAARVSHIYTTMPLDPNRDQWGGRGPKTLRERIEQLPNRKGRGSSECRSFAWGIAAMAQAVFASTLACFDVESWVESEESFEAIGANRDRFIRWLQTWASFAVQQSPPDAVWQNSAGEFAPHPKVKYPELFPQQMLIGQLFEHGFFALAHDEALAALGLAHEDTSAMEEAEFLFVGTALKTVLDAHARSGSTFARKWTSRAPDGALYAPNVPDTESFQTIQWCHRAGRPDLIEDITSHWNGADVVERLATHEGGNRMKHAATFLASKVNPAPTF